MSITPVSAGIKPEDAAKILGFIKNIQTSLPFLQNLNNDEIKKLRKMASRSLPYARENLIALKSNPNILPQTVISTDFVNKFQQDFNLYNQLDELAAPLEALLEGIRDTQKIIGSQVMEKADLTYKYLKQSADTDQNLTAIVAKIAEFNKKSPRKTSSN